MVANLTFIITHCKINFKTLIINFQLLMSYLIDIILRHHIVHIITSSEFVYYIEYIMWASYEEMCIASTHDTKLLYKVSR